MRARAATTAPTPARWPANRRIDRLRAPQERRTIRISATLPGSAVNSPGNARTATVLFTDIEGGNRLWDQEPQRMPRAMACHDALARAAVEDHRGTVVKMMGGGVYAVFDDALDAVCATLQLQRALADPGATEGVALRARCGLHAGPVEKRDDDYFGSAINRTARIMGVAHGGQVLVSQAVAALVEGRLPADVALRELGPVRLRGLEGTESVHQVLHPELRQDFPALSALASTPNNLPSQDTSFVDREHELEEVAQLLGETRLLTLLGTVGLGKSRLAREVAAALLDDYPDGVWRVDLAASSGPGDVPAAIATVLSLHEEAGVPLPRTLAAHLAQRRMLLLLDNCEQDIEGCARAADALLRAASGLRILATSREPMRVGGELTYPLAPLGLPQDDTEAGSDGARASAAVQLFVERATMQQPDFALDDQNAAIVTSICTRLDGLPLAIELAAAWVGTLSLDEVDARLAGHLALAEVEGHASPPQLSALRAALDRSYNLLGDDERTLFTRLSVFDASFDLAAAEEACGAPPLSPDDVLDLLTALADKSLVVTDSDWDRSLFRQYAIVREYARERAGESLP